MPQLLAAAGKVHAIAFSGPARLEGLPDIPTFAKSGLPGVVYVSWLGLAVRAGTPTPLIERLNREFARALATDTTKAWFLSQGATVLAARPPTSQSASRRTTSAGATSFALPE